MAKPLPLPSDQLFRGYSKRVRYEFLDPDGNPETLVAAAITVSLRLIDADDVVHTLTDGNAEEAEYPGTGADGLIDFTFSKTATAAMALGEAVVEVIYENTDATPDTAEVVASFCMQVRDSKTGGP